MKNKGVKSIWKSTALLFVLMLFGTGMNVKGQTVTGYTFTAISGAYTNITGLPIHGTEVDEACTSIPIGFTFNYCCNNYTNVSVSSNGWLSFNATTASSMTNNLANNTIGNIVAPLWDDEKVLGSVSYIKTGIAPNRIFTVQWSTIRWNYSAGGVISFQVKLYETSNIIEFIYKQGAAPVNLGSASIGLSGPNNGDFLSLNGTGIAPTASSETETTTLSTKPANGQIYRWTPPVACTGTPAPGNTVSSANPACSNVAFTLSMSNSVKDCGITYQWQSSPDSTTWTNINGATSATCTVTQTTGTYYRCLVTCANSGLFAYSTIVNETMNSYTHCYCTNTNTTNTNFFINSFSTTGGTTNITNNSSGFSANGYGDFTAMTVTQLQNGTINFSITETGGTMHFGIWVDWNDDGDFADAGEEVYINNTTYNSGVTGSFTVPLTATPGNHRMRIVGNNLGTSSVCIGSTNSECEDYSLSVTALPACSGAPTGGIATATMNALTGCPGYSGAIRITGASANTDLAYQWQSSPTGAEPWTAIAGATEDTYIVSIRELYYRRIVTCINSGLSDSSSSLLYSSSTPVNDECSNAISVTPNSGNVCTSFVSGTVACATASSEYNSCPYGTSDDDVWYKFVATNTTHIVSLLNIAGSTTDMYFAVYSGTCGSLTNLVCSDVNSTLLSGLTIGDTYFVRIYTFTSFTGQTTTFDLCISDPIPSAVCDGATPICTGTTYNFPASIDAGYAQIGPNYGCLASQPNPAWYYMKVGTAGDIIISINSSASTDLDFACWGPFTNPVSPCNASLTATGENWGSDYPHGNYPYPYGNLVDCSFNTSASEICGIPNATVGQYYLLLIVNYANVATNAVFSQTGGTGTLDCSFIAHPINNNGPLCVGQTLQLFNTNHIAGTSYIWTGPNGFTSTAMNPSIANISLADAGEYSMVSIIGGDTSDIVNTTVVVNPMPTAAITNNSGTTLLTCANPAINVTATGGETYSWSGGTSTNTAVNSFTAPGIYTVTVTNGGVCMSIASIPITQNIVPPLASITNNSGGTEINCVRSSISVTATPTGAVSYVWSDGDTTSTNNFTTPGTYMVTVTTSNGCTKSANISITQNIIHPIVGITNNSGGATELNCIHSSINVSATPTGASYQWSGGATTNTAANAFTAPGTYTVTVTPANGCTATLSIDITQSLTSPVASITNNSGTTTLTCMAPNISVTASGGDTYAWSGGNTPASSVNNFTSSDTYTVTVTGTNGCTSTSDIIIARDLSLPIANITNNTGTLELTCATPSINVVANGGETFFWNGGTTPSTNVNSFTTPGIYTVTVTGTEACTSTSSITITQNLTPPTITCPATLVIYNNPISAGANTPASFTTLGGNTNATSISYSDGTPSWVGCIETTIRTYTATASNGCTNTCVQNLSRTLDNIAPTFSAIPSMAFYMCSAVVPAASSTSVTATDNCSGAVTISVADLVLAGACANSYSIIRTYTATDLSGNSATASQTIIVNDNIAPVITGTPIPASYSCASDVPAASVASITATDNCSDAVTVTLNEVISTGTCANKYTITRTWTATDVCGNASTASQTITVNDNIPPTITACPSNQTFCSLSTGIYTIPTISATDNCTGTLTYSFAITGSTNRTGIGSDASGTFNIGTSTITWSVTDACGNTSNCNTLVTINETPTLALTSTTCSTDLSSYNAAFTSTSGAITASAGTIAGNTISNIQAGTAITITADNNGCITTINVPAPNCACPPIDLPANSNNPVICEGNPTPALTVNPPTAGYQINWYTNLSGGTAISTNTNTYTPTDILPATYTYYAELEETISGCKGSRTPVVLTINARPIVTITNNTNSTELTCALTAINVTATPSDASGYTWAGGDTPTTDINRLTTPDTYTVTVTGTNGCTATSSITITQNIAVPTAGITNNSGGTTELTCNTTNIEVIASGGDSYLWDGGATTNLNTNSFSSPATYAVTVTGANGCSATSSITITQDIALPSAGITNNSGGTTELTCNTASIEVIASGGDSYLWDGGATTNLNTNSFTSPATYTVTVTGANGCSATSSITITQDIAVPTVGITNSSSGITELTCNTASIEVIASGGDSYLWDGGATTNLNNNSFSSPANYTVTVTGTNGCTATSSITITQNIAVPTAGISNNSGGITELTCNTASIEVIASGGDSYLWDGGATTNLNTNSFSSPATYTVTVTGTNGCSATSSIIITQDISSPIPVIAYNDPTFQSGNLLLTTDGGTNYSWSGPNGFTSNLQNPTITDIDSTDAGIYSVTVTGANGCTATEQETIVVNPLPDAQFTYSASGLTVSFTNTSTDATSYFWEFGNGTSTEKSPIYTFPLSGQYTIKLTASILDYVDSVSQVISVSEVGINNNDSQNLTIFPNPAHKVITVQLKVESGQKLLSIIDVTGRLVYQKELQSTKEVIDLSHLSFGVYEVKINLDNRILHQRLILK